MPATLYTEDDYSFSFVEDPELAHSYDDIDLDEDEDQFFDDNDDPFFDDWDGNWDDEDDDEMLVPA